MPAVPVSQKDADRMVAYEADVRLILTEGTSGGTPLLPAQFTAALYDGTFPPLSDLGAFALYMKASFIAISRMMLAFQAFNSTPGPLPLTSASFTSRGQTLLIIASGSGFVAATPGLVGMDIKVDGVIKGASRAYTNEALSHKAFVTNALLVTGIAAGAHTISLSVQAGTSTDGGDIFSAAVIELPF